MKTLRQFLETQALFARQCFADKGEVQAMWVGEKADGELMAVMTAIEDKDQIAAAMRALFKQHGVVRYVFMTEAWVLEAKGDFNKAMRGYGAVAEHPDRREIVQVIAEDNQGGQVMGHAYILRPEHGKPKLSEFKIMDDVAKLSGRFTGILERPYLRIEKSP